jgi:molecular chaperone IbpA
MNDFNIGKLVFGPSALKDFDKFFVGFDDQFNRLAKIHDDLTKNIPNYPPYNIKKVDDNKYTIELAVAGFTKSNIDITLEDGKLIVKGLVRDDQHGEPEDYLFRGIANRAFTRMFALSDQVEVHNAELVNGMLKIFLERIIPEHKKPKKIEVSEEPNTVSEFAKNNPKQLLLEDEND